MQIARYKNWIGYGSCLFLCLFHHWGGESLEHDWFRDEAYKLPILACRASTAASIRGIGLGLVGAEVTSGSKIQRESSEHPSGMG
ncbi:MAG: hypothetical protein M2R45_00796 [Verrucomicrobia subdivision 3 bacterium]|nr:hypothetical protein [Limisphaerales bacterium]MCS1413099.1 hypothetical protein [Limisphaerales bacterium]